MTPETGLDRVVEAIVDPDASTEPGPDDPGDRDACLAGALGHLASTEPGRMTPETPESC